jgi:hypothetical protein
VNSGAREGRAVPTSYKTPAVLLIYTVKSGKCLGSDRGKKTYTKKSPHAIIILELVPSIVIFWTYLNCWRKSYSNKATLLLGWSQRYKNYTVVITIGMTVMKYPYLKWQWIFYFFSQRYAQTNTNKVNKKRALLQTTEGKDEPNIVFMRKSYTLLLGWSQRYKNYTVVITIWMTVMKYPYLKWQWIFYFFSYMFSFLYHCRDIYQTWLYIWVTRRVIACGSNISGLMFNTGKCFLRPILKTFEEKKITVMFDSFSNHNTNNVSKITLS